MDINNDSYFKQLLPLLHHIANANFVAFDLEMSGISVRSRFGPNPQGHDNGKPTLQQLYDETRTAAERYQVLQVGITCVEEDREKGYYLARPFNFFLSPLLDGETKIKDRFPTREIVLSSAAIAFLQGQQFEMGKVFSEGVYYLSIADEAETRERFRLDNERMKGRDDSKIKAGDHKALEFVRYVRKTISEWVDSKKQEYAFVNIGDPKGGDLNGYQRMLVYQLVKSEFPDYVCFGRNDGAFLQIVKFDQKREDEIQARKLTNFNNALARQIGLRWIFEALTGGDLSGIPTKWLTDEYAGKPELSQMAIDKEFEEVRKKLQTKEDHVIVGHNLFTDLVCLYKTFVGSLPTNVEVFQQRIHKLFPIIFDTKYLATEGHNSVSTVMRQGLAELLEPFKKIHTPLVVLHEKHTSYNTGIGKKHEAGFDSYMTAELFVKLSAQTHAERLRLGENFGGAVPVVSSPDTDEESLPYYSYDEGSRPSSKAPSEDNFDGGAKISPQTSEEDLLDFSEPVNGGAKVSSQSAKDNILEVSVKPSVSTLSMSMSDNLPSAWHSRELQNLNIADSNPFSVLANAGEGVDTEGEESDLERDGKVEQWIPDVESSFWHLYVNKLRVNACEGGLCDLNEQSDE